MGPYNKDTDEKDRGRKINRDILRDKTDCEFKNWSIGSKQRLMQHQNLKHFPCI